MLLPKYEVVHCRVMDMEHGPFAGKLLLSRVVQLHAQPKGINSFEKSGHGSSRHEV